MSLLLKLESIFLIVAAFNIMQYKLKNKAIARVFKKFIIIITNLLISYLIFKVDYINLFLVSKLIIFNIKFEVLKETSFANNSLAKFEKQITLYQHVSK